MRESEVERWLVKELKKMGCIADKFVSPGNAGVPDRIVIIPGGRIIFVELKTDTGELSEIQKWQIGRYKCRDAEVRVVYGLKEANALVDEVRNYINDSVRYDLKEM